MRGGRYGFHATSVPVSQTADEYSIPTETIVYVWKSRHVIPTAIASKWNADIFQIIWENFFVF